MTAIRSIEEQIAAMAATWPMLRLVQHEGRAAQWVGPLTPLFQEFRVQITYRSPVILERFNNRIIQPRVRILSPALRPRPGDPEGRLPHVYYGSGGADDVTLCLFDPDSDEWSVRDTLAATTVPWTIDWLTAYEGWRATGHWTATGRHVEAQQDKVANP